ncbi:MAG: hypothetical protein EBS49_03390 [Verrucomicrobia bacterium]|nr:hypothetical protein [Verrucomicrobiota bacterium]
MRKHEHESYFMDDEDDVEENMGMLPEPTEPGMEAFGGDSSDDMLGDVGDEGGDELDMGGDDEMGGDMDMGAGGEEELGDRLDDLESELEALRDEFESLMGDEGGEEGDDMGMGGDDMGMGGDDMGGEEEPTKDSMYFEKRSEEEEEEEEEEESRSDEDFIREYVEKVGGGNYNTWGKMGDDGVNTKSIIDNMKNDMGGTNQNILSGRNGAAPVEVGAGRTIQGNGVFKQSKPQIEDFGNVNKPGGNAGKTGFKKKEPGHGAEKKGEAEGKAWGAGTGGAAGQVGGLNTKSPLNGAPKRAK